VSAAVDEELGSQLTLEVTDLLRERGSGNVKAFRRPTEMKFLGNGDEVGQLPEFHPGDGTADLGR
jgi:hypothetical protein